MVSIYIGLHISLYGVVLIKFNILTISNKCSSPNDNINNRQYILIKITTLKQEGVSSLLVIQLKIIMNNLTVRVVAFCNEILLKILLAQMTEGNFKYYVTSGILAQLEKTYVVCKNNYLKFAPSSFVIQWVVYNLQKLCSA